MRLAKNNQLKHILSKIKPFFSCLIITGPAVETDFLPGALTVTESPPSPIGRAITWLIVVFLVGVVIWASVSKVDVVAVAQGRLVPIGDVKLIQSLEPGVITEIAVTDGQYVTQGQLLLKLDPTTSEADEANLAQRLLYLQCELSLYNALLRWDHTNPQHLPELKLPGEATETLRILYAERLSQETITIVNLLASLASNFKRFEAQEERIRITEQKFSELLKIDEEVAATYLALYKKQVSSRFQWLAAEQARIKTVQDRAATLEQLEEIAATKLSIQQELAKTVSSFRSDTLRKKSDVETEIASIEQELAKANNRNKLRILTAPVSGHIQQLAVHTLGGVMQSGETAMVIVPDGTELHLRVDLLNKDIGFIRVGQPVQVKLEAFPFTEYGLIDGEIATISADALQTENGDLFFSCQIKLLKNNIMVNSKPIELRPGMMATGEVVLRKRRLISYFLSPLLKHTQESLRER